MSWLSCSTTYTLVNGVNKLPTGISSGTYFFVWNLTNIATFNTLMLTGSYSGGIGRRFDAAGTFRISQVNQYPISGTFNYFNTFGITTCSMAQTQELVYDNGTLGGTCNFLFLSTTAGTTAIIGSVSPTGTSQTSALPFSGNIGEIICYNTLLTREQRQNTEGYLAWKWGLQGNLSSSHPYKLYPP